MNKMLRYAWTLFKWAAYLSGSLFLLSLAALARQWWIGHNIDPMRDTGASFGTWALMYLCLATGLLLLVCSALAFLTKIAIRRRRNADQPVAT